NACNSLLLNFHDVQLRFKNFTKFVSNGENPYESKYSPCPFSIYKHTQCEPLRSCGSKFMTIAVSSLQKLGKQSLGNTPSNIVDNLQSDLNRFSISSVFIFTDTQSKMKV